MKRINQSRTTDQSRARQEAQPTCVERKTRKKQESLPIARVTNRTPRAKRGAETLGSCGPASVHQRRGSTYGIVLMASLIVVSIGLASLASVRIQARIAQLGDDGDAAKRIAMAGMEYGLLYINQDSNWRNQFAADGWSGRVPIADGNFTTTASDPTDDDLLDSGSDPIALRSVGEVGTSRHLFEAQFEMEPSGAAIEAAVYTSGSFAIVDSTIDADAELFAAGNVSAFTSQINTAVRSQGTISGATYNGTQEAAVATGLVAPNDATALSYYLSSGTTIPFASLPSNATNLIANSDFESGLTGWNATAGCELELSTTEAYGGAQSVYVKNRNEARSGPRHDIDNVIVNGDSYRGQAWIQSKPGGASQNFRFRVRRSFSDATNDNVLFGSITAPGNGTWVLLDATTALTWDAGDKSLDSLTLRVETTDNNEDFFVDDVSFTRVCSSCARSLSGVVLTPTYNNIGGGTNSQGIYIIDCANQDIIVEDSRINGTLVLRNPGTGSEIRNSMNMEAAISGYPTLMVEGIIAINTTTVALNETALGRNFNPSGAEYPLSGGTSDSDTNDTYPSHFYGLVFSTGGFTFAGATAITGTVIANNSVTFNAVDFDLTHDQTIVDNPPPGFTDVPYRPVFVPGSFRRIVE